jgi:hypothetical protein
MADLPDFRRLLGRSHEWSGEGGDTTDDESAPVGHSIT